jgi:hypothetical protein
MTRARVYSAAEGPTQAEHAVNVGPKFCVASGSPLGRGLMYRHRAYQQVVYGHFNDFLKASEELNAIARKRGWPVSSIWTPVVGTGNEVVLEEEYADLASFQKVGDAFQSDAEAMKIFRSTSNLVVQGSVRNELLEEVKKPIA